MVFFSLPLYKGQTITKLAENGSHRFTRISYYDQQGRKWQERSPSVSGRVSRQFHTTYSIIFYSILVSLPCFIHFTSI